MTVVIKITLFIIILFLFKFSLFSQEIEFNGFYIEVIHYLPEENYVYEAQYLINEEDLLISLIKNPINFDYKKIKRLANYTSLYFELLNLPLPQGISKKNQIDWNRKVSLYRGDDRFPHELWRSEIADTNYSFYVKQVKVKIEQIEMEKKIALSSGSGMKQFHGFKIWLLKEIYDQKLYRMDVHKGVEKIKLYEALNYFHPSNNQIEKTIYLDEHGAMIKQKNNYIFLNW